MTPEQIEKLLEFYEDYDCQWKLLSAESLTHQNIF